MFVLANAVRARQDAAPVEPAVVVFAHFANDGMSPGSRKLSFHGAPPDAYFPREIC